MVTKQACFFAGTTITYTVAAVCLNLMSENKAITCGLISTVIAAGLKEWWWDARHPLTENVSAVEFGVTVSGGLLAGTVLYLV